MTLVVLACLSVVFALFPVAVAGWVRLRLLDRGELPRWLPVTVTGAGAVCGLAFGVFGDRVIAEELAAWAPVLPTVLFDQALVGPVAEELGKALVVLVVAVHWIHRPRQGLVIGLLAGAGFAAVENLLHFAHAFLTDGPGAWFITVIDRLLPSVFVHGAATALVGFAIGEARAHPTAAVRLMALPAGVFCAVVLHGLWNAMMLLDPEPAWLPHLVLNATAIVLIAITVGHARRGRAISDAI